MRNIVLMMSVYLDGFIGNLRGYSVLQGGEETDFPEEVRALKEQPSGELALSRAELAAAFLRPDLVDEFRVYVHRVLIGEGTRLFPPMSTHIPLRLAESRTFGNGVVLLRYERPPRASSTGEQHGFE